MSKLINYCVNCGELFKELTALRKRVGELEKKVFMTSSLDEIVMASNGERDRYRTALEQIAVDSDMTNPYTYFGRVNGIATTALEE